MHIYVAHEMQRPASCPIEGGGPGLSPAPKPLTACSDCPYFSNMDCKFSGEGKIMRIGDAG